MVTSLKVKSWQQLHTSDWLFKAYNKIVPVTKNNALMRTIVFLVSVVFLTSIISDSSILSYFSI